MNNQYSSRRQKLDHYFLAACLKNALGYGSITGYFSSSMFELAGEKIDSITGNIWVICNSDLHPLDVQTVAVAKIAL